MNARLSDEQRLLVRLREEDYERCKDLRHYVRGGYPWQLTTPGKRYLHNWHIDAICDHLVAVHNREIKRLVTNIVFRSMKSLLFGVMFPTWTWGPGGRPEEQFLGLSHNDALATRDALKSKRLIESDWYRAGWGEKTKLRRDNSGKTFYENEAHGFRAAFGFNSGVSGQNADTILIDDPHPARKGMYSEAQRIMAVDMYDQEVQNRLNDPSEGAILIVMQRLHEKDLSGHVLESGEFVHLNLPLEYEPKSVVPVSPIGWGDPRTRPGENMWPERFPPKWVETQKVTLGPYGAAAQLQQSPAPMGGGLVEMKDFGRYDPAFPPGPDKARGLVLSVDTANKKEEINDFSVIGTWADCQTSAYLLDVERERMKFPALLARIKSVAVAAREKYGLRIVKVIIEDKASGTQLIQMLEEDEEVRLPVVPFEPTGLGDKVARFQSVTPHISAGKVFLPKAGSVPWLADYEAEIARFPMSEHKDQVDMTSQFLLDWADLGGGVIGFLDVKGNR